MRNRKHTQQQPAGLRRRREPPAGASTTAGRASSPADARTSSRNRRAELRGSEDGDGNGQVDAEDIAAGLSADVDDNGIPDACPVHVPFRRGDANSSGSVDLSDTIFTLGFLFLGGPSPECHKSADANDSGELDLSDAVFTLAFLFLGGMPPAAPFSACGLDSTDDALTCESFARCP